MLFHQPLHQQAKLSSTGSGLYSIADFAPVIQKQIASKKDMFFIASLAAVYDRRQKWENIRRS
jgi:hypothetical protein